jgi:hypothetical protein
VSPSADARDEATAASLLGAVCARGDALHHVNVPEGDPASAARRALGGTLELRQFDMRKENR